jgi:hypothetical protein
MTEISNEKHNLIAMRDKLAEQDPTLLEFDLDDPDTALAFMVVASALLKGGNVKVTAKDDDGRTETISVESLGDGSDGLPVVAFSIGSSDGTLSPEGADALAVFLEPTFHSEIDTILGE